jgi:hypothetical protein
MKVSSLLKRTQFVVKPKVLTVPAVNWQGPCQLPPSFLVDRIDAKDKLGDAPRVYIFNPANDSKTSLYMPLDFDLLVTRSAAKDEAINKFHEYELSSAWFEKYFEIGSDPEIFVEDENGKVVPAFNFLGSKEKPDATMPRHTAGVGDIGSKPMYWDGFQGEFVTHPDNCLSWQVDSVQCGLDAMLKKAKAFNPLAKLSIKTTMDVSQEQLNAATPEQVQFGCMPSFNVYGLTGAAIPGRECDFRSAGGHNHFGVGKKSPEAISAMVKALDAILGVACVSLFASFDNPKRRVMYGLPGEYRLPPHGLEYRTLSNAWIFHPMIMHLVFDMSRKILVFGEKGLMKFWEATEKETIDCIRNCDVAKAREILSREKNKRVMFKLLRDCYGWTGEKQLKLFNVFLEGMESIISNPADIAGNWMLNDKWTAHSDHKDKSVRYAIDTIVKGLKVA